MRVVDDKLTKTNDSKYVIVLFNVILKLLTTFSIKGVLMPFIHCCKPFIYSCFAHFGSFKSNLNSGIADTHEVSTFCIG